MAMGKQEQKSQCKIEEIIDAFIYSSNWCLLITCVVGLEQGAMIFTQKKVLIDRPFDFTLKIVVVELAHTSSN